MDLEDKKGIRVFSFKYGLGKFNYMLCFLKWFILYVGIWVYVYFNSGVFIFFILIFVGFCDLFIYLLNIYFIKRLIILV